MFLKCPTNLNQNNRELAGIGKRGPLAIIRFLIRVSPWSGSPSLFFKTLPMHRGYVKLWRKVLDKGLLKDHKLGILWMYCLLKATHKDTSVLIDREEIPIKKGEFLFGLDVAKRDLGIPRTTLYTLLKTLEKLGMVERRPERRFTIISLLKWDTYQAEDKQDGTPSRNKERNPNGTETEPYKNKDHNKKKNMSIPTFSEIKEYAEKISFIIDPEYFIDYQTARDWKLKGGQKIKDWKAVLRTWKKNPITQKNEGVPIKTKFTPCTATDGHEDGREIVCASELGHAGKHNWKLIEGSERA